MISKSGKWDGKPLFVTDREWWHLLCKSGCIYAMRYCPEKDYWEPQIKSRMQLRSFEMSGFGYSYFAVAVSPEYAERIFNKPEARLHVTAQDDGLLTELGVLNGENLQPPGTHDLYTRPSAFKGDAS